MTKTLITSALPYASATKHLGNLCSSLLPADVHARFLRQSCEEVLFVCGTDDHGTPAELAAEAAGLPIADFVAAQHEAHRQLYRRFDLAFDWFGSTSSRQNHETTRRIILALEANGLTEVREIEQLYSPADGRFLPDRYVVGVCPHCGAAARGDQCENCTRLLDPEDLQQPRSAISGSSDLEWRTSRHLFLRQDLLAEVLSNWLASRQGWSKTAKSITAKWLDEGLEARCISRDLEWGVPIPIQGLEDKVAYVWFDAPIGYISIVKEWADAAPGRSWSEWWDPEGDVDIVQFVGKDSVPFHGITFPATLLGSGLPLRTVDRLKAFNWLTFEGGKFSTSAGIGVFLDQAIELLPADVWRWWLTANAPETDDVDFTFERLAAVVNSDLVGTFGNFVNRCLRFGAARYGDILPFRTVDDRYAGRLREQIKEHVLSISICHRALDSRKAAAATRALWSFANSWVVANAPWEPGCGEEVAAARFLDAATLVVVGAAAAAPIIPAAAAVVLSAFGIEKTPTWEQIANDPFGLIGEGRSFQVPELLFEKILPGQVEDWHTRFSRGMDCPLAS